jgi:hypothetical protein
LPQQQRPRMLIGRLRIFSSWWSLHTYLKKYTVDEIKKNKKGLSRYSSPLVGDRGGQTDTVMEMFHFEFGWLCVGNNLNGSTLQFLSSSERSQNKPPV